MDSLITASARALAAGDALGALKRVALRDDPPALALRGIAMAQLGDHPRARELLKRAARGFGAHEEPARARCAVAEAEVAMAMRDFTGSPRSLEAAAATLESHADNGNALQAWLVTARRLLLLGRLDEAAVALDLRDQVAGERRALPWVRVDKNYIFDTPEGKRSLADLFEGRHQLMVQYFMFGPGWGQGCPSCSCMADHTAGMKLHMAQRDVSFVAVSRATLPEIERFRRRMGWNFNWVSANGNDFNYVSGLIAAGACRGVDTVAAWLRGLRPSLLPPASRR